MNADRWTSRDDDMLESWADAYASLQKKGLVPPVDPEELSLLQKLEEKVWDEAEEREAAAKVDGFIFGALVCAVTLLFVWWAW